MEKIYDEKIKSFNYSEFVTDIFIDWENIKDEILLPDRKSGSGNGTVHVFLGQGNMPIYQKCFQEYYNQVITNNDTNSNTPHIQHIFLRSNILSMFGFTYDYLRNKHRSELENFISEFYKVLDHETIKECITTKSLFKFATGNGTIRPYFKQFDQEGIFFTIIRKLLIPKSAYKISLYRNSQNEYAAIWEIGFSNISDKEANLKNNALEIVNTFNNQSTYTKYLAAIKSKPFLLLAGISGTGKSRIVRQLARACDKFDSEPWEVQKPYNYEMISVKPNWHDSTELFGYISRVSGKPHYIVTDFLKFIAKAWMYEDIPFFLCLDEMNLAPVEQYFAEFLSVMESRKLINETNVITSDPLLYLSSSDEDKEMTKIMLKEIFSKLECYGDLPKDDEAYQSRLESLQDQFKKDGISIPRNLIVIGTVNMDETTYTFSRKVLDRAMTIEMNEVILTDGLNKDKEILPDIAPEWILPDAVEGYDFYDENTEVCNYVIEYLEKINEKLEGTPFKIAYRTRNDCMLYVVNSLKLCQESNGLTKDNIRDRALDEVTSMKILSRIEGDKKKVGETLSELERVIKEQFNLTDSDEDRAKSVSMKKLKEMNDRLTNTYYCSFWS